MNIISKLNLALVLSGLAGTTFAAGEIPAVSEPGTLTLLGLGGVVIVVSALRRWRK